MPSIKKYKCNNCTLELHPGWCGIAYLEDYEGRRIILTHPLENSIIERTLNIPSGIMNILWERKTKMVVVEEKEERLSKAIRH